MRVMKITLCLTRVASFVFCLTNLFSCVCLSWRKSLSSDRLQEIKIPFKMFCSQDSGYARLCDCAAMCLCVCVCGVCVCICVCMCVCVCVCVCVCMCMVCVWYVCIYYLSSTKILRSGHPGLCEKLARATVPLTPYCRAYKCSVTRHSGSCTQCWVRT